MSEERREWMELVASLRQEIERLREAGCGYSQQTMDAVIAERERLRAELAKCRRLLREAADSWTASCVVMSEDGKYSKEYGTAIVGVGWHTAAREAAGGGDE